MEERHNLTPRELAAKAAMTRLNNKNDDNENIGYTSNSGGLGESDNNNKEVGEGHVSTDSTAGKDIYIHTTTTPTPMTNQTMIQMLLTRVITITKIIELFLTNQLYDVIELIYLVCSSYNFN